MKIITGEKEFHIEEKTAVAIGKFDGIHRGHVKLLEEILKEKDNLKTVIFTFDPPVEELFGNGDCKYLTTKEEKRKLFENMGIDYLIEFPIDYDTAAIEPEIFVSKYIVEYMNASLVVCGEDVSFGNKGLGDMALLNKLSVIYNFRTVCISKIKEIFDTNANVTDLFIKDFVCNNEVIISSSAIRELVCQGKMDFANELLGYPYEFHGMVVHGNQLGRTMGVPTVNIDVGNKKVVPPFGVYFSKIKIGDKEYKSITNIGTKPTIKSDSLINAETFIYDYESDLPSADKYSNDNSQNINSNKNELYGENIVVSLIAFKRPEKKFDSFGELEKQIKLDIAEGRNFEN